MTQSPLCCHSPGKPLLLLMPPLHCTLSLHFPSSSPHHCKRSLLYPDSSSNSCLTSHPFTAKSPRSCLRSPHCTHFQLTLQPTLLDSSCQGHHGPRGWNPQFSAQSRPASCLLPLQSLPPVLNGCRPADSVLKTLIPPKPSPSP